MHTDQRIQSFHDGWLDLQVRLSRHSENEEVSPLLVIHGHWFSFGVVLFYELR